MQFATGLANIKKQPDAMNPNDTDLPLYEQYPNESARAYIAFKTYLEIGDQRTLEAVAQKLWGKLWAA